LTNSELNRAQRLIRIPSSDAYTSLNLAQAVAICCYELYHVCLNFNIYFKSVFPTVLSRAPERIGFGADRAREGVWLFHNRRLPARPRRHTQDMFLEFLPMLDVPIPDRLEWRIEPTDEERDASRRFFDRLGRPAAALVITSANPKKDWPADRYAPLADALHRRFGLQPVIIGGPSAREREAADAIAAAAHVPVVNALGDGVRRLVGLIAGSRLLIAPDTGPVHIARALDVPVIGLYGHTNPWRVGPYRRFEDLWLDTYNEPGDAPDPSRADPRHGNMERISVDAVLDRVERALAATTQPRLG
jgi:heptosyltransferase I